ncbi:MAG: pyridoxamine 5'-phosphate oxidase family protein [Clostridiales bacterium]|nr:pyridoxamine 5'-phosphate oxidase family protein [Clostridiales bacterium]
MFRKMRRSKQELSQEECQSILKEEKRGVLSVHGDDGYPYGVPMNFFYDPEDGMLYFHGAKEGHKIDAIKSDDKVCFTTWSQGSRDADGWSWYVDSVIAMGRAKLIQDAQKTIDIARKCGLKYYPEAEDVEKEIQRDGSRLQIIALSIEHLTGKRVHEK